MRIKLYSIIKHCSVTLLLTKIITSRIDPNLKKLLLCPEIRRIKCDVMENFSFEMSISKLIKKYGFFFHDTIILFPSTNFSL